MSVPLEEMGHELVDCCFPVGPEEVECDIVHALPVNVADGGMCCSEVDRESHAAAAAACVEYTNPRADLTSSDGDMCADLLQTRSPAAAAAACVGTTSPRAGLAIHDGSMDATAVCCVGQTGQPVDLPDRALYAACVDTYLPAVLTVRLSS